MGLLRIITKIIIGIFFSFFSVAFAAQVETLQSGTIVVSGTWKAIPITPVFDNKAILIFNVMTDNGSAGPQDTHLRGQLDCMAGSCNTINFERYGSNGKLTVRWQVIEFKKDSLINVQRGIETHFGLSDTAPAQKTIKTAVDRSKSFVLLSEFVHGGVTDDDDFTQGKINSSGDLVLTVGKKKQTSSKAEIAWQVVEYQQSAVQTGTIDFSPTDVRKIATIKPIDLSRSLLLYNYYVIDSTKTEHNKKTTSKTTNPVCQNLVSGVIDSPTQLQFERGCANHQGKLQLTWFVIEFSDATTIQHNRLTFTARQKQQTAILTNTVNPRCSVLTTGYHQRGGRSAAITDHTSSGWFSSSLDVAGKNLTLARGQTNNVAAEVGWFVVEFAGCISTHEKDYGDAPISGIAADGVHSNRYGIASHALVKGYYLGFDDPDADLSSQVMLGAEGDDKDVDNVNNIFDDDDILALPVMIQGQESTFTVFASGKQGYLQGWLDFNGNGMFDHDEQIAMNLQDDGTGDDALAGDGTIVFTIQVPSKATRKQTYLRLRWSRQKDLNATAEASDGEVEDYALQIGMGGVPIQGSVYHDVNIDGVNDVEEAGIAGITIVLVDVVNKTCRSTYTDRQGAYTFFPVFAGKYQLYEAVGETVPLPTSCNSRKVQDLNGYYSTTDNVLPSFQVVENAVMNKDFGDVKY